MEGDITILKTNDQQAGEKSLEVCLQEDSVKDLAQNARELFSTLQCELDELDDLKDGLSYLDMKNDTLLSYMIDLCNIVLKKVRGDSIAGHASVERSVYYRVILEKIKAIDQRLAYQLNKVISLPDAAQENQGVNVNNLDIELGSDDNSADEEEQLDSDAEQAGRGAEGDDEDDDESSDFDGSVNDDEEEEEDEEELEDKETSGKSKVASKIKTSGTNTGSSKDKKPVGIYKPPKLRSVVYKDGKEGSGSKRPRGYDEFDDLELDNDDNQDIVDETNVHRDIERTRYEEENYTRLPGTNPKETKRKLKEKSKPHKGKKKFKSNKKKNKW